MELVKGEKPYPSPKNLGIEWKNSEAETVAQ